MSSAAPTARCACCLSHRPAKRWPAGHYAALATALHAADGATEEVIVATNFTAEGEATAHVIGEALKARGLQVTRLARGVPAGSELEYVDLGTIAHALVDRR